MNSLMWRFLLCLVLVPSAVAQAETSATEVANALLDEREPLFWGGIANPDAVIDVFLENLREKKQAHGGNSLQVADATMLVGHATLGFFQKKRRYDRALKIAGQQLGKEHPLYGRYLLETSSELLRFPAYRLDTDYIMQARSFYESRSDQMPLQYAQVTLLHGAYAEKDPSLGDALELYLLAAERAQAPSIDEKKGFELASRSLILGVLYADEQESRDGDTRHLQALAKLFLGQGESGPKQVHLVSPDYPERLIRRAGEGVVTFTFNVTTSGHVRDATIEQVEGDPIFGELLLKVIERWRFTPRMKNGEFVSTRLRNSYRFVHESGKNVEDIVNQSPFN